MRKVRPMLAMSLDWHLKKCLDEYDFPDVSDKLRDQLVEDGMSVREATMRAPVMLEGLDRAHRGDMDFARIRKELAGEKADATETRLKHT